MALEIYQCDLNTEQEQEQEREEQGEQEQEQEREEEEDSTKKTTAQIVGRISHLAFSFPDSIIGEAKWISNRRLNVPAVDSALLQPKPGGRAAVEERVGAIVDAVGFIGSDYSQVYELHLREFILSVAPLPVQHDRHRHAGSEGVPHEITLREEKILRERVNAFKPSL